MFGPVFVKPFYFYMHDPLEHEERLAAAASVETSVSQLFEEAQKSTNSTAWAMNMGHALGKINTLIELNLIDLTKATRLLDQGEGLMELYAMGFHNITDTVCTA